MALSDDVSPAGSFSVSIDGIVLPLVREISGLRVDADAIDAVRQKADGSYVVHAIPGRPKPGEFTITRGVAASRSLDDWLRSLVTDGKVALRVEVSVTDAVGRVVRTWVCTDCWVRSLELSRDADGRSESVQRITIAYADVQIL
ncbi:phage tail protein [Microbacterium ulmi]|uniref:Phage tail protein n=1 Tax=Microbacterium ulmi TaxID=179095 RepID=A0A7Y2PY22_9MICO|nr:phage tail-like protein [Microbacterium ulmi]NNH02861.1 phage tail protein [Microbacterium ulmi]